MRKNEEEEEEEGFEAKEKREGEERGGKRSERGKVVFVGVRELLQGVVVVWCAFGGGCVCAVVVLGGVDGNGRKEGNGKGGRCFAIGANHYHHHYNE